MLEPVPRICCNSQVGREHHRDCPNFNDTPMAPMNILPTTRIGWDEKRQYIDRLIEAHTNEYLTDTEYEARMQWISTAQTHDQIKIPFKDLPTKRITEIEPTPKTRSRKPNGYAVTGTLLTEAGLTVFTGINGPLIIFLYFLTLTLLCGWSIYRAYRKTP